MNSSAFAYFMRQLESTEQCRGSEHAHGSGSPHTSQPELLQHRGKIPASSSALGAQNSRRRERAGAAEISPSFGGRGAQLRERIGTGGDNSARTGKREHPRDAGNAPRQGMCTSFAEGGEKLGAVGASGRVFFLV